MTVLEPSGMPGTITVTVKCKMPPCPRRSELGSAPHPPVSPPVSPPCVAWGYRGLRWLSCVLQRAEGPRPRLQPRAHGHLPVATCSVRGAGQRPLPCGRPPPRTEAELPPGWVVPHQSWALPHAQGPSLSAAPWAMPSPSLSGPVPAPLPARPPAGGSPVPLACSSPRVSTPGEHRLWEEMLLN